MNSSPMGRLENGVAVSYDFSISTVFKEGWEKVSGFKSSIWGGILIWIVASLILMVIIAVLMGIIHAALGQSPATKTIQNVLQIIRQLILYPIIGGMFMLGIKRAVNLPIKATMVLDYFHDIWRIVGVVILSMILITIPFAIATVLLTFAMAMSFFLQVLMGLVSIAFFLLGAYLIWSYIFALPLTIEKKLSIWKSLETSRKAVTQHWFKIFFLSWAEIIILVLASLPLLLGLIWALPWFYCVQGVLYRTLFGVDAPRKS